MSFFQAASAKDGRYDPCEVSMALEEWQIHEMEVEAQTVIEETLPCTMDPYYGDLN